MPVASKISLFSALFAIFLIQPSGSLATPLVVNDLQILGVTSDNADSFTFVLWVDIAAGTVIRFTENGFTSAAGTTLSGTGEADMAITFTSAATAGTVVRFQNGAGLTLPAGVTATTTGTINGLATSGDQIFAYQGNAISGTNFSGRTLLYGFNIANTSWLTTGTANTGSSYLPTAIAGQDANVDSGNFDNVNYSGTRTGMTEAVYRAAVGNVANYTQSNIRFALTSTSFTLTSSVLLTWDANGTTAGFGGSGTWDTTTQSRFSNSAGNTFLHWVNSSAGNDHTAVFGGTAGTVTVASGGVTASGLKFDVSGYTIAGAPVVFSASGVPDIAVTNSGHTATVSSAISGSNGMTKSGAGTLRLLANNLYTGATSVNSGALYLNGDNTAANGPVTVSTNATLGGTGTVGGDTMVSGIIAPGDPTINSGVGTLTFAKAVNFGPNSKLVFTMVSPSSADKIVGTGVGNLTLDADLQIFLDVTAYAANAQDGDLFDLIDWGGTVVPNGFNPDLDISVIGGPLALGLYFDFTNFLSSGTVAVTVTPEPSRVWLMIAAAGAVIMRRRRGS